MPRHSAYSFQFFCFYQAANGKKTYTKCFGGSRRFRALRSIPFALFVGPIFCSIIEPTFGRLSFDYSIGLTKYWQIVSKVDKSVWRDVEKVPLAQPLAKKFTQL